MIGVDALDCPHTSIIEIPRLRPDYGIDRGLHRREPNGEYGALSGNPPSISRANHAREMDNPVLPVINYARSLI